MDKKEAKFLYAIMKEIEDNEHYDRHMILRDLKNLFAGNLNANSIIRVERTIEVKMKGRLKDINAFCEELGSLSNKFDIDLEVR